MRERKIIDGIVMLIAAKSADTEAIVQLIQKNDGCLCALDSGVLTSAVVASKHDITRGVTGVDFDSYVSTRVSGWNRETFRNLVEPLRPKSGKHRNATPAETTQVVRVRGTRSKKMRVAPEAPPQREVSVQTKVTAGRPPPGDASSVPNPNGARVFKMADLKQENIVSAQGKALPLEVAKLANDPDRRSKDGRYILVTKLDEKDGMEVWRSYDTKKDKWTQGTRYIKVVAQPPAPSPAPPPAPPPSDELLGAMMLGTTKLPPELPAQEARAPVLTISGRLTPLPPESPPTPAASVAPPVQETSTASAAPATQELRPAQAISAALLPGEPCDQSTVLAIAVPPELAPPSVAIAQPAFLLRKEDVGREIRRLEQQDASHERQEKLLELLELTIEEGWWDLCLLTLKAEGTVLAAHAPRVLGLLAAGEFWQPLKRLLAMEDWRLLEAKYDGLALQLIRQQAFAAVADLRKKGGLSKGFQAELGEMLQFGEMIHTLMQQLERGGRLIINAPITVMGDGPNQEVTGFFTRLGRWVDQLFRRFRRR